MIGSVHIQNYKSVRELSFDAKRVNVFIGEPNTGKTNILEALALLSEGVHGPSEFREVFRFRSVADLFTDQQVGTPIRVKTSQCHCSLSFVAPRFEFIVTQPGGGNKQNYFLEQSGNTSSWINPQFGIKYYRFRPVSQTNLQSFGVLQPPFGVNLTSMLYTNKELSRSVSELFRTRNFRLEIRPVEMELRLAKVDEELYISFPYESISETWRRIVFYRAILETNQNSTILFDEPEAHTFPFYTKYLAERIALTDTNQFFITTHNPYLLSSIVEKTPLKDLSVFVTRMDKFESKIQLIPDKNLAELLELDADAFFNLDKLAGE